MEESDHVDSSDAHNGVTYTLGSISGEAHPAGQHPVCVRSAWQPLCTFSLSDIAMTCNSFVSLLDCLCDEPVHHIL